MGFFGKLFGKGAPDIDPHLASSPTINTNTAPNRIAYDPNLIQALLHDHAQLGAIYSQIGAADEADNFDEVRRLLALFKTRLEAHVLTENVRFYNFLEQSMAGDNNNVDLMRDFRREMNDIVRQVLTFTRKYLPNDLPLTVRKGFRADYTAIHAVLERRLDSEESSLYPLYQPVSH